MSEDLIKCPKCGSTQITAGDKGFGLGKAAVGGLLLGPVGLLGGMIGSKQVMVTCLKCGTTWEAGKEEETRKLLEMEQRSKELKEQRQKEQQERIKEYRERLSAELVDGPLHIKSLKYGISNDKIWITFWVIFFLISGGLAFYETYTYEPWSGSGYIGWTLVAVMSLIFAITEGVKLTSKKNELQNILDKKTNLERRF